VATCLCRARLLTIACFAASFPKVPRDERGREIKACSTACWTSLRRQARRRPQRSWPPRTRTASAYLGPDRAGKLLEVVSVLRDDGSEVVIHAMRMRRMYESWLRDKGDADD
jgi:hypothetical protein